MFVALELLTRDSVGIFPRLRGILSGRRIRELPQRTGEVSWMLLQVLPSGSGPDWEEIEEIALETSRSILLPEGVAIPPGSRLQPYSSAGFDRKVLLRTACEIIQRTRMPMYRRALGLIDPEGGFSDLLPELLKYYTTVRVVTENQTHYRSVSEEMMWELGATVVVSDRLSCFSDCVLVLCPGPYESDQDARIPCPVLTGASCSLRRRCDTISSLEVLPPQEVQAPPGIPPHLLAAALYESLEEPPRAPLPDRLLCNYRMGTVEDAVEMVGNMAPEFARSSII